MTQHSEGTSMPPAFTRGFRLHHNGHVLDGAAFPSGRVFVLDDPEYGFATGATSMEELLLGYHGARVEWEPVADRTALRDRIAEALARFNGWHWAAANLADLSTPGADRYRHMADAVMAELSDAIRSAGSAVGGRQDGAQT
ncbi:hypothetical protein ACIRJO_02745 [Streptomyces sp. NPDC102394]|uniref:hypothetical protein n=1 Tax=Streptomyces sp. NPDC102394 TaxID=3366167 RepID=UPI0037FB31DC